MTSTQMKFKLRLLLNHPSVSSQGISHVMGISDKNLHRHTVGNLRSTPKGTLLSGTYNETRWSTTQRIFDRRDFFVATIEVAKSWEPYGSFYRDFCASGGEVNLIVEFGNAFNLGDNPSNEACEYLHRNKVTLGLELFPGSEFG